MANPNFRRKPVAVIQPTAAHTPAVPITAVNVVPPVTNAGRAHSHADEEGQVVQTKFCRYHGARADVTISFMKQVVRNQFLQTTYTDGEHTWHKKTHPFASPRYNLISNSLLTADEKVKFFRDSWFEIFIDSNTIKNAEMPRGNLTLVGRINTIPRGFLDSIEQLVVTVEVPKAEGFIDSNTPFTPNSPMFKFVAGLLEIIESMKLVRHLQFVICDDVAFKKFGSWEQLTCITPFMACKKHFKLKYEETGSAGRGVPVLFTGFQMVNFRRVYAETLEQV